MGSITSILQVRKLRLRKVNVRVTTPPKAEVQSTALTVTRRALPGAWHRGAQFIVCMKRRSNGSRGVISPRRGQPFVGGALVPRQFGT